MEIIDIINSRDIDRLVKLLFIKQLPEDILNDYFPVFLKDSVVYLTLLRYQIIPLSVIKNNFHRIDKAQTQSLCSFQLLPESIKEGLMLDREYWEYFSNNIHYFPSPSLINHFGKDIGSGMEIEFPDFLMEENYFYCVRFMGSIRKKPSHHTKIIKVRAKYDNLLPASTGGIYLLRKGMEISTEIHNIWREL